jgi:glyoxylase-like metal-dependent hydrolase (beta-lactamase superfamily II)
MEQVAPDIHRISVSGKYFVNTYLVGDVIVDAGMAKSPKCKILPALEGHEVSAHALTHAHSDHVGGSNALASALGVPVWASEGDASPSMTPRTGAPRRSWRRWNPTSWCSATGRCCATRRPN